MNCPLYQQPVTLCPVKKRKLWHVLPPFIIYTCAVQLNLQRYNTFSNRVFHFMILTTCPWWTPCGWLSPLSAASQTALRLQEGFWWCRHLCLYDTAMIKLQAGYSVKYEATIGKTRLLEAASEVYFPPLMSVKVWRTGCTWPHSTGRQPNNCCFNSWSCARTKTYAHHITCVVGTMNQTPQHMIGFKTGVNHNLGRGRKVHDWSVRELVRQRQNKVGDD